jgi:hypothetical protein
MQASEQQVCNAVIAGLGNSTAGMPYLIDVANWRSRADAVEKLGLSVTAPPEPLVAMN